MRKIISVITILMLSSCGSGQLKSLVTDENEAIIIAKASIKDKGKLLEKRFNLLWDERLWGKYPTIIKKDGYIFSKLPEGKHSIMLIQRGMYKQSIPEDYLTINIEKNKIYYLGDIIFNWNTYDEFGSAGGVLGAVIGSGKNKGIRLKVDVKDNFEETTKIFNEKFGNTKPVEKQLLKVNINN